MKQGVSPVYAEVGLTRPGPSPVPAFPSVSQLTDVSQRTVRRLNADVLSGTLNSPKGTTETCLGIERPFKQMKRQECSRTITTPFNELNVIKIGFHFAP